MARGFNTTLRQVDVYLAYKLYVYLQKNKKHIFGDSYNTEIYVSLIPLICAYGGMTLNELVELTGKKEIFLKAVLQELEDKYNCVKLDKDLVLGRTWYAKGTKGVWKVSYWLENKAFELRINPGTRVLQVFAITLNNIKEHMKLMANNACQTGSFALFNTVLEALTPLKFNFKTVEAASIIKLGYLKNRNGVVDLNRNAYLTDKRATQVK